MRLVVKITKPKWISTFGCPSLTCDQSSLSVILPGLNPGGSGGRRILNNKHSGEFVLSRGHREGGRLGLEKKIQKAIF